MKPLVSSLCHSHVPSTVLLHLQIPNALMASTQRCLPIRKMMDTRPQTSKKRDQHLPHHPSSTVNYVV
jgi:hypothetical protein